MRLFSKTHQSSLTLKGGSTSHLGLLPSGKKRKPPYSVLKPLRYKVGGPSEVYASSGAAVCGMRPHGYKSLTGCLVFALSLLVACLVLAQSFFEYLPGFPNINEGFFRKPTSPPLPLREGPPLISVFSPQGRRGNRPTRCSNRFAIRLADHQRSRQQRSCSLRYATAWIQIAYGLLGACSKLA